jgi:ferritin
MLKKKLQDALNDQLNHELYSAYLYLSMAAYAETINLPGFAHWMRHQYDEEVIHGMKFYEFINDRGGQVVLKTIKGPPTKFKSPLDLFEKTLEHERFVSESIRKIYALATKENDYESQVFLQWFITEQIEEEKTADDIIQTLKRAGDDGHAILMIDRELGARQPESEEG